MKQTITNFFIIGIPLAGFITTASGETVLYTTTNDFTGWTGNGFAVSAVANPDHDGAAINGVGNTNSPGAAGTPGSLKLFYAANGSSAVAFGPNEGGNSAFLSAYARARTLTLTYETVPPTNESSLQITLAWRNSPTFQGFYGTGPISNVVNGNLTTATYNLSGLPNDMTWFQLGVAIMQSYDSTSPIYIDSFQLHESVPEPPPTALGQAPGLEWVSNVGARLFAVDAQTNVYASTGGKVVVLNGSGVPLQTNNICPLPGVALRDSFGNFYFSSNFDGTQNFGGITLVGGWTNFPFSGHWTPGYPTCFLAKYTSAGNLLWVTSFGTQAMSNYVHDVAFHSDGSIWVGFTGNAAKVAQFSNSGSNQLTTENNYGPDDAVTVSSSASGQILVLGYGYNTLKGWAFDASGGPYGFSGPPPRYWRSPLSVNGKAVPGRGSDVFIAALQDTLQPAGRLQPVLAKCEVNASPAWSKPIGDVEQWLLAGDDALNLYLSGTNGMFSKWDENGTPIWSTNYFAPATKMLIDSSGNRFVSFTNGSIARLQVEPAPVIPAVVSPARSQTVFAGDSVTLEVIANGTPPLHYLWQKDWINLPNATNAVLSFGSVVVAQSGNYSVVISNAAGAVTSAPPALLRVKQVALYAGGQLLTNGSYVFSSPPTFSVRSAFSNGSAFYTLDGSTPSFASQAYSGPFIVLYDATVRAIGYNADFFESEEADAVSVKVLENHRLLASSSGGGSVSLQPAGGVYTSTNVVTVTATAVTGWTFLHWLGDASGTNASISMSMNHDKAVYAVFGTTLSTTVAGPGQVLLEPPGGVYPYGTRVRLTGVPQTGSYFGSWGNAASGNSNPLYFFVTNANPTVSSIFGPTPSGQAALTVLITGQGVVNVNPRGNIYSTTQTVTLMAVPDSGQSFLGWSGDAAGTANPLSILMSSPKAITASFSNQPRLRADRIGLEGLNADGFRFTLAGSGGQVWQVLGSTNLTSWDMLGTVTNASNETQFMDGGATNLSRRFYRLELVP